MRKYLRIITSGRPAEVLLRDLRKAWQLLLYLSVGVWLCVALFAFIPVVVYLTKHEVLPLLPMDVIFCDMTKTTNFIIANIVHMIMGSYSAVGSIFHSSVMIFCFATYILQGDLFECDLQELNGVWNGENKIPTACKHAFLINICKKRQDMNK